MKACELGLRTDLRCGVCFAQKVSTPSMLIAVRGGGRSGSIADAGLAICCQRKHFAAGWWDW